MSSLLKFNRFYFVLTLLLFVIEILIALFTHDPIIRPYIGDVLVVILIYCFVKSFVNTAFLPTAIGVLLFSYLVEALQYFKIVNKLGLKDSKLAKIIIGTSFAWLDLLAYTVGIVVVIYLEIVSAKRKAKANMKNV